MAFLFYIIRQVDYNDPSEKSQISLQEWLDYANSDPELEPAVEYSLDNPLLNMEQAEELSKIFKSDLTESFEWYGHPRSDADTIPCFHYWSGSIMTKYPDNHTIGKMIKIAAMMNAKVIDEDENYYDETYFTNGGYPIEK